MPSTHESRKMSITISIDADDASLAAVSITRHQHEACSQLSRLIAAIDEYVVSGDKVDHNGGPLTVWSTVTVNQSV